MTSTPHPAYSLALSLQPSLTTRFGEAHSRLCSDGCTATLSLLEDRFNGATAAINMSVSTLIKCVESGAYLNKYEVVAPEMTAGKNLFQTLKEKFGKFLESRLTIDELLGMGQDGHYAYLNVGGTGPSRWGSCAVLFDLDCWSGNYTAFSGDSINACFDEDLNQVLTNDEILDRFAVGEDTFQLSTVFGERSIRQLGSNGAVGLQELFAFLEHQDSLVELHLLGAVRASAIKQVVMEGKEYQALQLRALEWEDKGRPATRTYGEAPLFLKLQKLLKAHGIPLVTM